MYGFIDLYSLCPVHFITTLGGIPPTTLRTKKGVFCAKEGIMCSGRGAKVVLGLECMQFGRLTVTQYVRCKLKFLTDHSSA